jgi:hypothetical protein
MVALGEQGNWNLPLNRPIEIEHGEQRLATLAEVGAYILALPETLQRQELRHAAAETVLEGAEVRPHRARCARVSYGSNNVGPERPHSLGMRGQTPPTS